MPGGVRGALAAPAKPTPKKRKEAPVGETKEQGGQGESREREREARARNDGSNDDIVVGEGKPR